MTWPYKYTGGRFIEIPVPKTNLSYNSTLKGKVDE